MSTEIAESGVGALISSSICISVNGRGCCEDSVAAFSGEKTNRQQLKMNHKLMEDLTNLYLISIPHKDAVITRSQNSLRLLDLAFENQGS
jgi:hypothetical protein